MNFLDNLVSQYENARGKVPRVGLINVRCVVKEKRLTTIQMNQLHDISLIEAIKLSRNPTGIFLFGYGTNFYLAATGACEPKQRLESNENNLSFVSTKLSKKHKDKNDSYLDVVIGGEVDPDIHHFNILPCNPSIWPRLRDEANIKQPGLWTEDATFEDHLVQAVKGLLENVDFEKLTFPTCPLVYFRSKYNRNATFEEHYRKSLLEPGLGKQTLWTCWGYLIRQGIPLYALRHPEDVNIVPLLEPKKCMLAGCKEPCISHCGRCGWKFYCSRDHQVADWTKHKKECVSYA